MLFSSSPVAVENGNIETVSASDCQNDVDDDAPSCSMDMLTETDNVDNLIQSEYPRLVSEVDGGATYDEPWDLRAARLGLESRLRAVHSSPDQLASVSTIDHSQLSDPRPFLEYDEPWDRRVKDVQRNLISAKSAKEEARAQREGGFNPQMVHGSLRRTQDCTKQRTVDPKNIPSLSKRGEPSCSARFMLGPKPEP